MADNLYTPELRLVQGDAFKGNDKNMQGQPKVSTSGQPYTTWFVACAGRKGDPAVEEMKRMWEQQARAAWPQLHNGPGGACTNPKFSIKIVDGDGYDDNGVHNGTKQGFAGHWIFKFSSGYAPRCFQFGKWKPAEELRKMPGGPDPIPLGCYVKVSYSLASNQNTQKPGMYVNLHMIAFTRPGDPIVTGVNPALAFGDSAGAASVPGYAPAPAMAPPPAPVPAMTYSVSPALAAQGHTLESLRASGQTDANMVAQGWLIAVAAPVTPPQPPAPPAAPNPPQVAVAPAPGILTAGSVAAPPPPAPTAVAPAAPGFKMADPTGTPYAGYIGAGWTDAQLIANNLMVPA